MAQTYDCFYNNGQNLYEQDFCPDALNGSPLGYSMLSDAPGAPSSTYQPTSGLVVVVAVVAVLMLLNAGK